MTPRDMAEGNSFPPTALFAGLAWEASRSLNLITELNGRNLKAGIAYYIPNSSISLKLGVENLTRYSGDGPIVTGSVGMMLARL